MRFSRRLVAGVGVLVVVLTVALVLLRNQARCGGFSGPGVSSEELPPPVRPGEMRIGNWNIRNFPLDRRPQEKDLGFSRRTNICDLEDVLRGLDADVLGVEEITDTREFPLTVQRAGDDRRYEMEFSSHGGGHGQSVGLIWDRDRVELVGEPIDISSVAVNSRLRPGLAGHFRSLIDPTLDFTIVQVHLAATPKGASSRRRQFRALAEWVEQHVATTGDPDVIVQGDFNTTGWEGGTTEQELHKLDSIFSRVGLRRLRNASGCTEYWEGPGGRDGVQVPSLLDLVYVGGLDDRAPSAPISWLHCSRMECQDLVSIAGNEDGTFWDVSDHCPVTFELSLGQ
ncbi:MAG: hypothetical protein K8R59_03760 [Thermoanaerobaculales bacterium]|nr:hypothetical protein [Thermoanaerobaculales bacterium]